MSYKHNDLSRFCVVGISYRKSDADLRSLFALPESRYRHLLDQSKEHGIEECFGISTCNRTEIYGISDDPSSIELLLCANAKGDAEMFHKVAYVRYGIEAITHLFHVASGLDSQILGDYEVIGQIKQATSIARDHGCIGTFIDRLLNTVIQASKKIKNQTSLSSGTVSVSYAAVRYLIGKVPNIGEKHIALIGTGKFGRTTCKHLVSYLNTNNITLLNRTPDKALRLAKAMKIKAAPMSDLCNVIKEADIILVATSAAEPIILKSHLDDAKPRTIIDLSIPFNVEKEAGDLPNITLITVDMLSRITDSTLLMRQAEVPKAKDIIHMCIEEFLTWAEMRRHAPVLKAVKTTLKEMHQSSGFAQIHYRHADPDVHIQQVINAMALKMKESRRPGCQYIEAINDFIS